MAKASYPHARATGTDPLHSLPSTLKPCAVALAAALGAMPALAQDAVSAPAPAHLGEVVVTASGFEQALRQAPASISVINREELETRQYRDLAEALSDVEGIDVRGGTGKTGGFDISIRGMPSSYTLILIDGRRQNVAGDVTPNGFGAAHTSLMPPIAAIERIEVVRGPMATLYGSDAMGGVINIITRRVAKQWGGSLGLESGIPQDSDDGAQHRLNLYVNGPLVDDLLGIAVRGDVYRRAAADWVLAPGASQSGRNPAPAESRQHTLGVRLTLTPNSQHDLWLDVEQNRTWYNNDDGRLGNRDAASGPPWTGNNPAGYKDWMRFNRDQVAVGHTARFDFGMLESSFSRTVTETLGRTIPGAAIPRTPEAPATWLSEADRGADRTLETTNTIFDTKLVAPLGDAHIATVGAQWWDARLEDGLLPKRHGQTMWSLFVEDEWHFTDTLAATFGGRYDRHDAFGGNFSPRAYLVWNATEQWTLKGGVSQGFRAPTLNQLIDGVSGVTGQGATITIGNPNLKPETSTSTELSALYDSLDGLSGSVTLFHNKIKDRISSGGDCTVRWISSCVANPTATYSINTDEGKTWGVELSGRIQLAPRWSLNGNYTWTDSESIVGGRKVGKLSDTAKHIANAQLRWDATEKFSLWLRGEYRGKSRRFDQSPSNLTGNNRLEYEALGDIKGYSLFHLGGAYRVSQNVTINGNIFNLLDKDFRKFSQWTNVDGEQVWASPYFKSTQATKGSTPAGRTFWVSANIDF